MNKTLALYCAAALLLGTSGMAQPCHPEVHQQQVAAFWDHFKQLDTIPPLFLINNNRLYKTKNKALYFMGSFHSPDVAYPLYRKIDSVMDRFKPAIVLVENYYALEGQDVNTAVAGGADIGYVSYLAAAQHIRVKSWDKVPEVYNQLIPVYGYDSALVVLLNSIGDYGYRSQGSEEAYARFTYSFQLGGGILTPAQLSYDYYQRIFQQYYQQRLLSPTDTGYTAQQWAVQHHEARQQCDSRFTQLRDKRLLQVLRAELPAYDKVYLQAGAAHFQSLQEIIPCYLTPAKPTVKRILTRKGQGKQEILLTTKAQNGTQQQIMIGFVDHKDSSSRQLAIVQRQLEQFAPDIVLTSNPALIFGTREETVAKSGTAGLVRRLAIEKEIAVDQWPPSWGDVYHQFIKSYSAEDIYLTCFAMNIAEDGAIRTIDDFRDKYDNAGNKMRLAEYPFQAGEFDFDTYIARLVKGAPRKNSYSFADMQSLVSSRSNKALEEEIKRYQLAWFFRRPLSGLQNLSHKKIFLQVDEGYRAALEAMFH